jgi:hypothetical protein
MKITNQRLLPAALFVSALQMSPQPPSEAKTKASIPPRFEDYRVSEVFNGQPSPPILATPEQRMFRTRITDGVSKGWGVLRDGREGSTPGPNFAGHYIAIQWGCGTDCGQMAIVDGSTGLVYPPPFGGKGKGWSYFHYPARFIYPPQFQVNSQLLILPNICAAQTPVCGTYYFVWRNNRWHEVRREPMSLR